LVVWGAILICLTHTLPVPIGDSRRRDRAGWTVNVVPKLRLGKSNDL